MDLQTVSSHLSQVLQHSLSLSHTICIFMFVHNPVLNLIDLGLFLCVCSCAVSCLRTWPSATAKTMDTLFLLKTYVQQIITNIFSFLRSLSLVFCCFQRLSVMHSQLLSCLHLHLSDIKSFNCS